MNNTLPLSVENVTVGYDKTPILSNVTFHVQAGETFGLVGLNGEGKTTFIKAILGLRSAQAGKISLFSQSNTTLDSKAKSAYLPEKFDPPAFMTGVEFIRLSQQLYHRKVGMAEIVNMALRLGLAKEALQKRVSSYSKGMRQKLGLMATLLTQCPLLILDEPMSGLDPRARVLVKEALLSHKDKDRTIMVCSHILADLDEICDRIGIVHDGGIVFVGTPAELKAQTSETSLERAFLAKISDQEGEEPAAA